MISRGQRILFWTLLISSVLMAVVLLRMRERAMDRLLASAETMPLNPPAGRPVQSVTMMMANDMDGSLQPGGVVFETNQGNLDASVDSQLAEIERGLADHMRRQP